MSRVGKKPVAIPSGVTASVEGQTVKLKGPKGALSLALHGDVAATVQGSEVKIDPRADTIVYPIPEGITITVPRPTEIVVAGIDEQKVGHVAAEIRAFRKPEPYKGKGVKYAGEYIFRKEGKKK